MTILKITSIASIALMIAACHSSKKSTTSATATAPPPATTAPPVPPTPPAPAAKPSNGVFAPGNEQLTAIIGKYPDASLAVLADGYAVYTGQTCTGCHGPKDIYRRSVERWPAIIDDMAHKASITETQKDAVLKYVLSIKASQPSGPAAK